jgi:LysR family transcriptional regulator, transcription activator of glutamate synthase operon
MELNQLKYFMAVAEREHMTRAAEALHLAQPALTKSIRKLEKELGYPLVMKKGRNIELTAAGRALRELLADPLSKLEAIPGQLHRMAGGEGTVVRLKLLAASTFATACVVDYRAKHPECRFDLMLGESSAGADLVVDTCDMRENVPEGLTFTENVYLAVPKDSVWAEKDRIALKKVSEETFITLAGNRKYTDLCTSWCHQAGFVPRSSFEGDSPATVRNLISLGCGVGFWPERTWGDAGEGIALLKVTEPNCGRKLVIRCAESPDTAEGIVGDFVRAFIGEMRHLFLAPAN